MRHFVGEFLFSTLHVPRPCWVYAPAINCILKFLHVSSSSCLMYHHLNDLVLPDTCTSSIFLLTLQRLAVNMSVLSHSLKLFLDSGFKRHILHRSGTASTRHGVGFVTLCRSLPPNSALSISLSTNVLCFLRRSSFLRSSVCVLTSVTIVSRTIIFLFSTSCFISTFATSSVTCHVVLLPCWQLFQISR